MTHPLIATKAGAQLIRTGRDHRWRRRVRQIALEQIAEAERAITGSQTVPSGLLRISVSAAYGTYRLLPLMPRFTEAYPQIEIELSISDKIIDFVEEGFDLAIRLGIQRDLRLVAYKLEDASSGLFSTSDYLLKKGTPLSLDDLEEHDCIQYVFPHTGRPMQWLFTDEKGAEIEQRIKSRLRVLNDALGCIAWLNAGGGLYQTYRFAAVDALKRGDLVEVLQNYAGALPTVLHPLSTESSPIGESACIC